MFPKKKSAREERRAKERKESKVARAELKEKARKEELLRERQEALRKLEAVKERTLKQTAIRKAFEERQGDPGATSGVDSLVMTCGNTKATLTIRLVSASPGYPVVEGTVQFAANGNTITKRTTAAVAFLPLKQGATVTVTGVVTNPPAARYREAQVTLVVVVPDQGVETRDLTFTPIFDVEMVTVTPEFFPVHQQASLQYL